MLQIPFVVAVVSALLRATVSHGYVVSAPRGTRTSCRAGASASASAPRSITRRTQSQSSTRRRRRQPMALSSETTTTADGSVSIATGISKSKRSVWFPHRIQDTLDYDAVVERLFLRHIVTETEAMAVEALQLSTRFAHRTTAGPGDQSTAAAAALNENNVHGDAKSTASSVDPFGEAAAAISACAATRDEGGTIGWVDRPPRNQLQRVPPVAPLSTNSSTTTIGHSIVADSVIEALYRLQPKAGDTHILFDAIHQRWHVLQVAEIWMKPSALFVHSAEDDEPSGASSLPLKRPQPPPQLVGAFAGRNVLVPHRRRLKGHGVLPEFPELRTYHIHTAGCQMNVADSERMAGILRHDLALAVADTPGHADLVLFNTCSIRDHAEQKLYDALGPYAAAKRSGKRIALIVTGCVAQQQGEALLRRVPEIDAVLGPQYVPHLQNVLAAIATGRQLVATAPMLLPEHGDNEGLHSPPVRGHPVRAWVNVIHGCNEHCTYCVVPGTRGLEQSRTIEAVLRECLALAAAGYKEVTLLGQNIDAYGRDMVPKRTFAELLQYLNAHLPDKMRIRYVRERRQ